MLDIQGVLGKVEGNLKFKFQVGGGNFLTWSKRGQNFAENLDSILETKQTYQ